MKTKNIEHLNEGNRIKAGLYDRSNAVNGKYRTAQLGLDDLAGIKSTDLFLLETLEMKADLADKMIAEAESQGKNTSDPKVMKELGEEINILGTPLHKSDSTMTAIFVSLRLIVHYAIAIGIWGLVFKNSFFVFSIYGAIFGLAISLLFVAPVIASQRTKEKIREMSFAVGALWGNLGIIIGVVGLVALVIRLIIFR